MNMDDREVGRYWNENAAEWTRGVRAGWDVYRRFMHDPAFYRLLPPLAGQKVLDLGCGEGLSSRQLADMGATVVGIDVSDAMIVAAREHEKAEPHGIVFHTASGSAMETLTDASFDAVVSVMALMDLSDYPACTKEVARVLKPGGLFQFSILHPCVHTPVFQWVTTADGRAGLAIGNYFGLDPLQPQDKVDQWHWSNAPPEAHAAERPMRVPRFWRTVSEYLNVLLENGFVLSHVAEPYADSSAAAKWRGLDKTRYVPWVLIVQCHKLPISNGVKESAL